MLVAISSIAAAFCSRFMSLLRRTYGLPAVFGEELRRCRRLLGPGRVDLDPWAHGGRQGDRLDVPALRAGRLGADDLVVDGSEVVDERLLLEGRLADREVHVRGAIRAV